MHISNSGGKLRAAVYCRVSTKHNEQEDSLENQIEHYRSVVGADPSYALTEIYYDFGISGYKEKRPGFQKMLTDARNGRFDILITKSISRFSRNTATVLNTTRELKELGVGIYFELQNINTLSQDGELLMTLYAAFAQAESEGARKHSLMAIKRKYETGNPPRQLHRCLGYSKDKSGRLFADKDAELVRELFEYAAAGLTISEITAYLNSENISTKRGCRYSRSSVMRILRNEAYTGDYVGQRYYVDSSRKLVPNDGSRKSYFYQNDHEAIISRELFESAQMMLDRSSADAASARKHPADTEVCDG